MKPRMLQPVLPFFALPLLTMAAFGQTVGVSHPDQLNDSTPVTDSDHYVKPTHATTPDGIVTTAAPPSAPYVAPSVSYAAPQTSAPSSLPATRQTGYSQTGYADSYAATGPAPAPASAETGMPPTPALIVRQPGSAPTPYAAPVNPPVQTASYRRETLSSTDGDNGIVTSVPEIPFQLNAGTVLRARLEQTISSENTPVGTRFSAQLLHEVSHRGEVLLPAGTMVRGRLTKVHGGKRITGAASLRLQPETVTLPDGTTYAFHATVSGLENFEDAHVNDEGTILEKTHPEIDAAALGLTTTAAAVTGAVIGGCVGAAVGATVGAGVGTYMWLNRDHQAMLPAGVSLLLSLDEPLQLNPR